MAKINDQLVGLSIQRSQLKFKTSALTIWSNLLL